MNENLTSNNIENEDLNLNTEEIDYKKLINKLKEIKKNHISIGKYNF